MRGLLLGLVFFSMLPLIFIKGPFFGILMWFWVSLMNPQMIVWSSIFAGLNYALIVAVATLTSWMFSREPKLPPRDKVTALIVLMMIWISLTSWLGTGPPQQIYTNWLLAEKMLLMTAVAFALISTRERIDQVIVVCALSIAVYGVKGGIFTIITGGNFRVWGPGDSMIGGNNELGVALTMTLPLLFYMRQRYRQPYFKWPMLPLIGLTVIGDLFTYSRGAFLAIGAMAIIAWLRSRRKILSAIMAAALAATVWNFAPQKWFARMSTIQTYQQDESAESRLYVWQIAWAMALKRPLTGAGFHWSFDPVSVDRQLSGIWNSDLPKLTRPRAAHSIWLEMLSDQGFPGLILFLGFFLSAALDTRWLIRHTRRRPDLAWANHLGRMLQASMVAFAVGGTFASLEFYDFFYALVVITAATRRVAVRELAKEVAPAAVASLAAAARSQRSLRPQLTR